jgi:group II intron reverse transcriptase/maturase
VNSAEFLEERTVAAGNSAQSSAVTRTQSWGQALTGLGRVREAARKDKNLQFTNLMHHITPELLWEAFFSMKKTAASGVDEVTWHEYRDTGLLDRLRILHDAVQSGCYKALPSRRTWIPKDNGERRGLGIASLEDKIVQLALVRVLEAIYETDFLGFSYGFRPGRSQHDALDALVVAIKRRRVNWVIDADVRKFFDMVNHDLLIRLLKRRITDERVLRLIRKWLKAGVMEDGCVSPTETGTPQGAVVSPLLANVFLHYVLDLWIHMWRQRNARGMVSIVRYADDFVIGCEKRDDAQRLYTELFTRFADFGLILHPDKTRLIEFGRFAREHAQRDGKRKPETFTFLGFTHICSVATGNKGFNVLRLSRKDRFRAKLREVKDWLRINMHKPVPVQGRYLKQVVRGWLQYHAVPGNNQATCGFRYQVGVLWFRSLRRRSHKARALKWERMNRYIDRWLPPVQVLHPYPKQRFASRTCGRSRMR